MSFRIFLRMARLAQNPPSMKKVIFVVVILCVCIAIVLVEKLFNWPELLQYENMKRMRVPKF